MEAQVEAVAVVRVDPHTCSMVAVEPSEVVGVDQHPSPSSSTVVT